MSIPAICRKKERASDEKYFLGMYLGQIEVFRGLPPVVLEMVVTRLGCRTYRAGEVIHAGDGLPEFMGVVFVGGVVEKDGRKSKHYGKQEVVGRGAFYQRESYATLTAK